MDSSLPNSTRPGWVRQVSCVGIGVFIETVGAMSICGVEVGEKGVGEGTGCSDGEQAVMNARSVSRIVIHFAA